MELNRTYLLRVLIDGKLLTYTAKILTIESDFITFRDKFGKKISVNKNIVQSFEEVKNGYH